MKRSQNDSTFWQFDSNIEYSVNMLQNVYNYIFKNWQMDTIIIITSFLSNLNLL